MSTRGIFFLYDKLSSLAQADVKMMLVPGEHNAPHASPTMEIVDDERQKWFDYWLKDEKNGITAGESLTLYIPGEDVPYKTSNFPLAKTKWQKLYLTHKNNLIFSKDNIEEGSDLIKSEGLSFLTEYLDEDIIVLGPSVINFYGSISGASDVDWVIDLVDIDPSGEMDLVRREFLRGSFRNQETEKTKAWRPWHSFTKPVSLKQDEIYSFNIEVNPLSYRFLKGHKIGLIFRDSKCIGPSLENNNCWPYSKRTNKNKRAGLVKQYVPLPMPEKAVVYYSESRPSYILLPVFDEVLE